MKEKDRDNTPIMTIEEADRLIDKYVVNRREIKLKVRYRMDNKKEKKEVYIRQDNY